MAGKSKSEHTLSDEEMAQLIKSVVESVDAAGARKIQIPHQTFGFENCAALHWKLYWEIARLGYATPRDPIDMKCFAFNGAVTAWCLTDWVFEEMTTAQRDHYHRGTLREFQDLAREQCRALHLCRQIATASKHRTVRLHVDPAVGAALSVEPVTNAWEIVITDGATTHQAIDVLEEARLYWYHFLSKLGLMDD
jgi:hypothetical protein